MPYHKFALPVSSSNLSIERNGETYPVLLDTDTFDRTGEDGDIPIMPICSGDEFIGESLEGQWHRGFDSDISAFTATISGGTLRLTGVAAAPGTEGVGWINSQHPAPLVDELEVTVSMEVPVDDTGATAARDLRYGFLLRQDKAEDAPGGDDNFFRVYYDVDEDGLIIYVQKKINGATTTLDSGYDYTMDGTRSTGNYEATIWRFVFNGKPGTTDATISIYLKQAATLALAEVATENELDGSPYDLDDLAFNIAYPSYRLYTQHATYFGTTYASGNRAASTYLRFDYPAQFNLGYNWTEADYGETDVQLWDGDPDTTGIRVYDEDHEFTGDTYIQNGLMRVWVDELAEYGVKIYGYSGAAYTLPANRCFVRLITDAKECSHPTLKNIVYISPEQVILKIRLLDTATVNDDYYVDVIYALKRGAITLTQSFEGIYPIQEIRPIVMYDSVGNRFGYAGDNAIGDDDLNLTGNNSTLTDNFVVGFDNDNDASLFGWGSNTIPAGSTTRFQASDGANLQYQQSASPDILDTKIYIYITPFPLVANLFLEAEDGTSTGSTEADALASAGFAEMLNAQTETVYYDVTAGTDLPAGTYLAVFRIRDINQIAGDVGLRVLDTTDTEYRNEEGAQQNTVATAIYAYYSMFFYISDADVAATDNIRIQVLKTQAGANEIYVDYFLIIPIGDGMNWPQDLAHSALRGITQHPRLCER